MEKIIEQFRDELDDEADAPIASSTCCSRRAIAVAHAQRLLPSTPSGAPLALITADRDIAAYSRGTSYFLEDLRWSTALLGLWCIASVPLMGMYIGLNAILAQPDDGVYDGSSPSQWPSALGAMPAVWLNAGVMLSRRRMSGILGHDDAASRFCAVAAALSTTVLALAFVAIGSYLRRRLTITAGNARSAATTPGEFTVMVRHLPASTTAADLAAAFSDWGVVKEVQLHRSLDWDVITKATALVSREARAVRAGHAVKKGDAGVASNRRLAKRQTKREAERNTARAALKTSVDALRVASGGGGDALAFVSFDDRATTSQVLADMQPWFCRIVACGGGFGGQYPFLASASFRRGSKLVPRAIWGGALRCHFTAPLTLCCGAEVMPAGEPEDLEWRNLKVGRCSHCCRWLGMVTAALLFTGAMLSVAVAYVIVSAETTQRNLSVSNTSLAQGAVASADDPVAKAVTGDGHFLDFGDNFLQAKRIVAQRRDLVNAFVITMVISALRKVYYYLLLPLLVRLQRQGSVEMKERTAFFLLVVQVRAVYSIDYCIIQCVYAVLTVPLTAFRANQGSQFNLTRSPVTYYLSSVVVQEGAYLALFTIASYVTAISYSMEYYSGNCDGGVNVPGQCVGLPLHADGTCTTLPETTVCTTKDTKLLLAFRVADNFATYCLLQLLSGIASELALGDPLNLWQRFVRNLYACCSRNQSTVNRRWVIEPRAPWEMHFDAVTTVAYACIIGPWWPAVVWLACIKLGLLYASVKWGVLRVRQMPPQYEATLLMRMQRVLRWATAAGILSTAVLNAHLIGMWSLFTTSGEGAAEGSTRDTRESGSGGQRPTGDDGTGPPTEDGPDARGADDGEANAAGRSGGEDDYAGGDGEGSTRTTRESGTRTGEGRVAMGVGDGEGSDAGGSGGEDDNVGGDGGGKTRDTRGSGNGGRPQTGTDGTWPRTGDGRDARGVVDKPRPGAGSGALSGATRNGATGVGRGSSRSRPPGGPHHRHQQTEDGRDARGGDDGEENAAGSSGGGGDYCGGDGEGRARDTRESGSGGRLPTGADETEPRTGDGRDAPGVDDKPRPDAGPGAHSGEDAGSGGTDGAAGGDESG